MKYNIVISVDRLPQQTLMQKLETHEIGPCIKKSFVVKTEAELISQHLNKEYTDNLLHHSNGWLRQYEDAYGYTKPPVVDKIAELHDNIENYSIVFVTVNGIKTPFRVYR